MCADSDVVPSVSGNKMAVTFTSGLGLLQWWGCRVLRQWTRPSGLEPQHLILSTSGEQCCWTGRPLRSLPFPNLCDPNPAAIPGTNNAKMYTWFQRKGWREPLPPCNSPCEARRVKLGKGRLWKGESHPVPCLNLRRENPKQTEAIWTEQYVKKYFRTKWGLSKECKVSFTLGQLPY